MGIYDAANPNSSGVITGTQGDGLLDDHTVVLFNSTTDAVLAYAQFSAGATGADAEGFIYATPTIVGGGTLTLTAGTEYTVAADYSYTGSNEADYPLEASPDHSGTAPTPASGVTLGDLELYGATINEAHPQLSTPPGANFGSGAFVGPNVELVPEPSTTAMMAAGLGLLALLGYLRREKLS